MKLTVLAWLCSLLNVLCVELCLCFRDLTAFGVPVNTGFVSLYSLLVMCEN